MQYAHFNGGNAADYGDVNFGYSGAAKTVDPATMASNMQSVNNAQYDADNAAANYTYGAENNAWDATAQKSNIAHTADTNYGHDLMNYASMGVGRMPAFQNYALQQGRQDVSDQSSQVDYSTYQKNLALAQMAAQAQNKLSLVKVNTGMNNAVSATDPANAIRGLK